MAPKKVAKRKAKAKAGSKKRPREEDEEALPDLGDASSHKEPPQEEADDDAPLISMMPDAKVAKTAEPEEEESLPSFAAAAKDSKGMEDEDDEPLITAATLGKGEGDGAEGDIWHQLETELRAPLHAAPADEGVPQDAKSGMQFHQEDSDDDWGIAWKGEQGSQLPGANDVLDEIARKAAESTNWHKQEWAKKEEPRDQQDDEEEEEQAWGTHWFFTNDTAKSKSDDWQPDMEWISEDAFSNSKEAMAVENVVRKIRSRANEKHEKSSKSGIEAYPNDTLFQVLKRWVKKPLPDQRTLLAVMLFVEAQALDMEVLPPDLNSICLSMLTTQEVDDMRNACRTVPPHLMLKKADAKIPDLKLRKEIAPEIISQLKTKLSSLLVGSDVEIEEEDLGQNIDTLFLDIPATVKIMGLVHCCEYVAILKRVWDAKEELFNSIAKQVEQWRSFEVLCRLSLRDACVLAKQTLDADVEHLRKSKSSCLNRLAAEWKLAPREEDMMLLHMLGLNRQIQVLLSIERDVELQWCELMAKVEVREERSGKLREYLNFTQRLRPYLNEEDLLPGKKPLEKESGQKLEIYDLAMVRQGVSEIFKKLKQLYKWKPDRSSRTAISKTNWVARLSAVLKLVKTTYTLSADKELRKFLQLEASRNLGSEIYKNYVQWRNTEQGDGLQKPRKRIASEHTMEEMSKKWEELISIHYPESTQQQQPQHQPRTPAGLGVAAMTPGLGAAMTPGLGAAMTPGLNPGTPGLSGAVTPGFRAPTPTGTWQSGFTPAFKDQSEGNTPQWRPTATPLGPFGAGTPLPQGGTPGRVNMHTPLGHPLRTPIGVKLDGRPAVTPSGLPPPTPLGAAGAQPMTPPETKVKDVKAE